MAVLLVWEEVPESTKFYRLEGDAADAAIRAHGCFVNVVDGDPDGAADKLNMLLEDIEPLNHEAGPIATSGIEKVVLSGFVL